MKKIKIALVLLLAMLLSVALFACGGEPEDSDTAITGLSLQITSVSFTDEDDADDWDSVAGAINNSVRLTTRRSAKYVTLSECICDLSGVQWHNVGSYTVTVKYDDGNNNNYSDVLEVVIDHNFELAEGRTDMWVCTHDGATKTAQEINATLNFQGFHQEGNYELKGETGSIQPFGTVATQKGEAEVRTTTVGRLEKGMTITVYGKAENTNTELAYYFPILGFADKSAGNSYNSDAGTTKGISLFVRNEGWVLLNGVGSPRLLASLAGGSQDGSNYGSHPTDLEDKTPTYVWDTNGYGPSDWNQWGVWDVYSYGTISRSATYAVEGGVPVKFSWSYLDSGYDDGYGMIVLTYYILKDDGSVSSSLTCRVKVPDSANGYYDSILHGEYVDMSFTKIETIMTSTLKEIYYEGLKDGAKTEYLENEYLDFSSLTVSKTTEQKPDYAQREPDTSFEVWAWDTRVEEADKWVDLSTTPLSQAMTQFKIVRISGTITKEHIIDSEEGDQWISIKKNAVDVAYGYPQEGMNVNGTLGAIGVTSAVEGSTTYVKITLSNSVYASTDATSGKKYVSFRLWANENGTKFRTEADSSTKILIKGTETALTANDDYKLVFAADGSYVDVLIYFTDAVDVTKGVVITGLVPGETNNEPADVIVDLSQVQSTAVASTADAYTIDLLAGGDVKVTYQIGEEAWIAPGERALNEMTITVGSSSTYFSRLTENEGVYSGTVGAYPVKVEFDESAYMVIVTYTLPGITASNPLSYNLSIDYPGLDIVALDTIYYNTTEAIPTDNGSTETGIYKDGLYVTANGTTLYILSAISGKDIQEGNIASGTINLSINVGTTDSFNYLDLGYTYAYGAFVFSSASMNDIATGKITVFGGEFGNKYDYDYGAVSVLTVNLSKLISLGKDFKAPYYFELNADGAPCVYLVDAQNKISAVEIDGNDLEIETIVEGSCLSTGYAGALYKGNEGDFYAGVSVIGGKHVFVDGVCTHCGATETEAKAPTSWYLASEGYGYKVPILADGEFVELIGQYSSDEDECGGASSTYNGFTLVVTDPNVALYILNPDFVEISTKAATGNDLWAVRGGAPTSDVQEYLDDLAANNVTIWKNVTTSLITEDHPSNTIEGHIASDGTAINAQTFNEAKVGATYRYTLTYVNEILTVRMRLYKAGVDMATGTPWCDYEYVVGIKLTSNSVIDLEVSSGFTYKNSTLNVVKGKLVDSVLTGGSSANDVISFGAPSVSGTVTNIVASGMAIKETSGEYTHKAEFTLNFSTALSKTTMVVVKNAAGNVVEGATATLTEDCKHINVYLPLTVATASDYYTLELTNKEGYTLQGDIKIDFSNVAVSDIDAVLENHLTLAGGTFTVTYTGSVTDDMKFVVNGTEKAANAIAVNDVFGDVKVTAYSRGATTTTITFTQSALNFTQKLSAHTVALYAANGKLQAQNTASFNALPTSNVIDEDAYVVANGTNLTFVFTKNVTPGLTNAVNKTFKLNANMGASEGYNYSLIALYNLSFKVNPNGTVEFIEKNSLNIGATAVYSLVGSSGIVAITVDVSALDISADDAYAFESYIGDAADTAFAYSVATNRTLTALTLNTQDERATVLEATCASEGLKAIAYKQGSETVLYFDLEVVAAGDHNWVLDEKTGYYICSECHSVKVDGEATGAVIDKANLANVYENGLSVSFISKSPDSGSDWNLNLSSIRTNVGSLRVMLTNLQGLNKSILNKTTNEDESVTYKIDETTITDEALIAAYEKINENFFPGVNGGANGQNGGTWDSFYGKEYFVTITMDTINGVRFYQNNVLKMEYPIDQLGNGNRFSCLDFVTAFLKLAEIGGVTIGGSQLKIEDAIVEPYTLSAGQIEARYNAYVDKKESHVHDFSNGDICSCGLLNPNHGDTANGGLAHNYVYGYCTICGELCTHDHVTGGECDDCGAVIGQPTTIESIGAIVDMPSVDTVKGLAVGLNDGEMYVLNCTVASNTANEAFFGLCIQIWDENYSKELVFHQGNNNPLPRTYMTPAASYGGWGTAKIVSGIVKDSEGNELPALNKTGMEYTITVVRGGNVLYVTYELSNDTVSYSGTTTYTLDAIAQAGEVHLWYACDAITVSNAQLVKATFNTAND